MRVFVVFLMVFSTGIQASRNRRHGHGIVQLLEMKVSAEERIGKKSELMQNRDTFNFLSPLFYKGEFDYKNLKKLEFKSSFKVHEFSDCTILFSRLSPSLLEYFTKWGFNPVADQDFDATFKKLFSYENNKICPGYNLYFTQYLLNKLGSQKISLENLLKFLTLLSQRMPSHYSKSDIHKVFLQYFSRPRSKKLDVFEILSILVYTSEPHELKYLNLPQINKDQSPTYQRITQAFKEYLNQKKNKENVQTKSHRDFEVGLIIGKALRKIRIPIQPEEKGKEVKVLIPEIIDDYGYIPERVKFGNIGTTYSANACDKRYLKKFKQNKIHFTPSLTSTSLFKDAALGFLLEDKEDKYEYNNRCLYLFRLKYSYDLGELSLHPEEAEILLPPFLPFEITSVELDQELKVPDKNGGIINQKILGFIEASEVDINPDNVPEFLNITNGRRIQVKKDFLLPDPK